MARGVKPFHFLVHLLSVFLDEVLDERGNVFFPFSQGRQKNGNDMDSVIEVFTKKVLLYVIFQIFIGGDDEPDIHFHYFFAAHGVEFSFLKHPQQLGLNPEGHISDLIQKEGALMGLGK